jgi:hypothetical protein
LAWRLGTPGSSEGRRLSAELEAARGKERFGRADGVLSEVEDRRREQQGIGAVLEALGQGDPRPGLLARRLRSLPDRE